MNGKVSARDIVIAHIVDIIPQFDGLVHCDIGCRCWLDSLARCAAPTSIYGSHPADCKFGAIVCIKDNDEESEYMREVEGREETVKEVINAWLKDHDYYGLKHDDDVCYCQADSLNDCIDLRKCVAIKDKPPG